MSRGWNRFIDVKGVACLSHLENDLFQPHSNAAEQRDTDLCVGLSHLLKGDSATHK